VPFTINDIQQCRDKLGRYTEDPDKFTIEFQTLALGFDLSWRDIQFLLVNCCTPTEREKILAAAHREADEASARDPVG
jgi:S-methylmethionine-dependent homocysteine/selenocysteine methylase